MAILYLFFKYPNSKSTFDKDKNRSENEEIMSIYHSETFKTTHTNMYSDFSPSNGDTFHYKGLKNQQKALEESLENPKTQEILEKVQAFQNSNQFRLER